MKSVKRKPPMYPTRGFTWTAMYGPRRPPMVLIGPHLCVCGMEHSAPFAGSRAVAPKRRKLRGEKKEKP